MERALALLGGHDQFPLQHLLCAVIGQLEIVDTSHDAWQIVVRTVRGLTRLADNREHWRKTLESANGQSRTASDELQEITSLRIGKLRHV